MAHFCSRVLSIAFAAGLMTMEASAQSPARHVMVTMPDGATIRCIDAGRGPSPTVLFVPGWTMPAEIWARQLTDLQTMYRVVAMDPRAQGQSSAAADGLYPAGRARDIKAVVDQLELAPVVVVGWSMAVNEVAAYVDQFGTCPLYTSPSSRDKRQSRMPSPVCKKKSTCIALLSLHLILFSSPPHHHLLSASYHHCA